jgi:hypothetical protein
VKKKILNTTRNLVLSSALLFTTGCATITGTLFGALTSPISLFKHHTKREILDELITPQPPFILGKAAGAFILGPLYGAVTGARADWGYLKNGEYAGIENYTQNSKGELIPIRALPFKAVFDPWNKNYSLYRTAIFENDRVNTVTQRP